MAFLLGIAVLPVALKRCAIVKVLKIKRKSSSTAVGFVGNARALSKDLWAT
jgi:hypothetical protein